MRQLEITGAHAVRWTEVTAPALQGDGEALVRPLAVAMCDLDAVWLGGAIPIAEPFPLGHECIAEVIETGDEVAGVAVGDVVVVPFQISCGECAACAAGRTGNCDTVPRGSAYGMQPLGGPWGGALADVLRVPFADAMLVPLPDGARSRHRRQRSRQRRRCLSLGGRAARARSGRRGARGRRLRPQHRPLRHRLREGAGRRPCGLRRHRPRSARARRDARERRPSRSASWPHKLGSFPVTVDASGDHGGLHAALRSTAPDGTCTSVAVYFEPATPVPLLEMYTRGCTLHTGRCHARALIPEVLALIAAGRLDPAAVTSAVVSFDDAESALVEPPTKLVLVP